MITYTLAKKLKEAGFPQPEVPTGGHYNSWVIQNTHGEVYVEIKDKEPVVIRVFPGMCYARELVYIPALSELIEVCGDIKLFVSKSGESIADTSMGFIPQMGKTPEEAVANLWMALNKKDVV